MYTTLKLARRNLTFPGFAGMYSSTHSTQVVLIQDNNYLNGKAVSAFSKNSLFSPTQIQEYCQTQTALSSPTHSQVAKTWGPKRDGEGPHFHGCCIGGHHQIHPLSLLVQPILTGSRIQEDWCRATGAHYEVVHRSWENSQNIEGAAAC